jgi:ribose 5-phosphate isomerase B
MAARVHLASDHAAYELKVHLAEHLPTLGYEVVDHGPPSYDPEDDYPVYVLRAAQAVADEPGSLGVVLGGSGNGEQIAANRLGAVRAALAWNLATATLARQHNDANVISVGARMHSVQEATSLVEAFLAEPFSGEARHARRIQMLTDFSRDHQLPPLPGAPVA